MKRILTTIGVVTVIGLVFGSFLVTPRATPPPQVRGRAYGLFIHVPSRGVANTYFADTGWLPGRGGNIRRNVPNANIPGVVVSSSLTATTEGDDCEGESGASVGTTVLLPGDPAEVSFTLATSADDDSCCANEGDDPELAIIQDLTIGGIPVTVTGQFNQQVVIPGVGTLMINEVVTEADDDCDDDDFTVNALHLVINGPPGPPEQHIIVASSFFESDDQCCPLPVEESTWGKIKSRFDRK